MTRYTPRDNRWADSTTVCAAYLKVLGSRPRQVRRLSGGFNNANFAIDERLVLRLFSGELEVARREARVIEMAAGAGVRTPEVVAVDTFEGRGVLVISLMPGRMMDERADFEDVGAQLATIHSLKFDKYGLFRGDGELDEFSPELGRELIEGYLDGTAGRRLGPEKAAAVRALEPARPHPEAPTLVHSDFNPKNILVGDDGRVTAVLDWEFAMAADPLIDLGNFFRFPEDYEPSSISSFLQGYRGAGGSLPADWERQAQRHDMVSLLDFLDNSEEYPETFSTARQRLDKILERS